MRDRSTDARETRSYLGRLDAVSMRERARQSIRASIVAGEIAPGEIYPIGYFVTRLGVSATPIREALIDLANEGLIRSVRNRGYRVPELSIHDLEELFDLRLMLEVPAVGGVAKVAKPDDIAECRHYAAQIEECADGGDLVGMMEADRLFHLRLLQTLGNERLVRLVGRLRDETRLYGLRYFSKEGRLGNSVREHRQLLSAVERGDVDQAEALMRLHLEHTREIVSQSFEHGLRSDPSIRASRVNEPRTAHKPSITPPLVKKRPGSSTRVPERP